MDFKFILNMFYFIVEFLRILLHCIKHIKLSISTAYALYYIVTESVKTQQYNEIHLNSIEIRLIVD